MNLRNRTVDTPLGAHFTPVKNKTLCDRIKFHVVNIDITIISVKREIIVMSIPLKVHVSALLRMNVFGKEDLIC